MTSPNDTPPAGEFILFQSEDGHVRVECRFESDTLWLSQSLIAQLYGVTPQSITQHLRTIYEEGELEPAATCKEYLQVQTEGKRQVKRNVSHYSLPVILAVGYRVRSPRGTQFRRWATQTLEEYLIKGFVMDDERLKNPPVGQSAVPDYFDEMLERIRDIRASERRVYLRVKDIFTMAADYTPTDKDTNKFFQIIQNKLHFASTGLTAAELIAQRVDANKPNVGLSSFKNEAVRKTDVTIAKNYLNEAEIAALNRIVTMWLDFAEDQALRRKQVFLKDWQTKLDDFLRFNDRDVLQNAGTLSKKAADEKAKTEFDRYTDERRRLTEAEGAQTNIDALRALLDEKTND